MNYYEFMFSMKTRSRCSWCCSNVWSNTTFVLQKSPLILMGMPYQHIWQLFLMTHYESLRCLDLDHSRFQAILTAQTVWCPSVMTRGVGDAERALDTLNYSSIRGRSRLRQKGWGLSRLNIYQLGEFGTILLWSFNFIEFLCLWVWAYKSFQVPHYVEPTSLDEHPVFFVISGTCWEMVVWLPLGNQKPWEEFSLISAGPRWCWMMVAIRSSFGP